MKTKKTTKKDQERVERTKGLLSPAKEEKFVPMTPERVQETKDLLARLGFQKTGLEFESVSWAYLESKGRAFELSEIGTPERAKYEGLLARAGWYRAIEKIREEIRTMARCDAKETGVGIPCGRIVVGGTSRCAEHQVRSSPSPEKKTEKETQGTLLPEGKKITKGGAQGAKVEKKVAEVSSEIKVNLNEKKETPMSSKNAKKSSKETKGAEEKKVAEAAPVEKKTEEKKDEKKSSKETKKEEKTSSSKKDEKKSSKEEKKTEEKSSGKKAGHLTLFKKMCQEAAETKSKSLGTREDLKKKFEKRGCRGATLDAYLGWSKAGLERVAGAHVIIEDEEGNLKVGKLITRSKK